MGVSINYGCYNFNEETDKSFVFIGFRIATLTYGGLLGIFLINYINDKINSNQIVIGLLSSIVTVSYLLWSAHIAPDGVKSLAWTFYIPISFIVFVATSHLAYYLGLFNEKENKIK